MRIMEVVFIKTNIQKKMMNTTTVIQCLHISKREWAMDRTTALLSIHCIGVLLRGTNMATVQYKNGYINCYLFLLHD